MEDWWLLLSYSSIDIALASNVSQCKACHIRLLSLSKRPVKVLSHSQEVRGRWPRRRFKPLLEVEAILEWLHWFYNAKKSME